MNNVVPLREYVTQAKNDQLLFEQALNEGVGDVILQSLQRTKQYFQNVLAGLKAHKELASMDGKKSPLNKGISVAYQELFNSMKTEYTHLPEIIKKAIDKANAKLEIPKLNSSGVSLRRDYYTLYTRLCMLRPLFNINFQNMAENMMKVVADKFLDVVIAACTQLSGLKTATDVATMVINLIKTTEVIANHWSQLIE